MVKTGCNNRALVAHTQRAPPPCYYFTIWRTRRGPALMNTGGSKSLGYLVPTDLWCVTLCVVLFGTRSHHTMSPDTL